MNKDYIIKEYRLKNLYSPQTEVFKRMSAIENITKDSLSPVKFEVTKNSILRITKKIQNRSYFHYGKLNKNQMENLAAQMDIAFHNDLIHGDLNRKNIIIDNQENLVISDWEPDLKQYINGKLSYMVTLPWVDKDDMSNEKVSINTDLICFFRCISNKNKMYFYSTKWDKLIPQTKTSRNPFGFVLNEYLLEKETINE